MHSVKCDYVKSTMHFVHVFNEPDTIYTMLMLDNS